MVIIRFNSTPFNILPNTLWSCYRVQLLRSNIFIIKAIFRYTIMSVQHLHQTHSKVYIYSTLKPLNMNSVNDICGMHTPSLNFPLIQCNTLLHVHL